MNDIFRKFLEIYTINPEMIEPLYSMMSEKFGNINNANEEQMRVLKIKLAELQKKIDTLEESYFTLKEMNEETYRKFKDRYSEEKAKIYEELELCGKDCSNLSEYYISALQFSMKLPLVWASSPAAVKEKIRKMVFPDGVVYNHKNGTFRTEKVNEIFTILQA